MAEVFIQSIDNIDIDAVWSSLSELRRQKITRLKSKKQALLSAAAELALNDAVSKWFPDSGIPVKYSYDENGKPYLTELNAHISLSHSGRLAACAISDREVGIDIQQIKKADMRVAERFFSVEENEQIRTAGDSNAEFFKIWVKKEARVKLTGEGIGAFSSVNDYNTDEYEYNVRCMDDEKCMICVCERKK